jgi:signal peptidase
MSAALRLPLLRRARLFALWLFLGALFVALAAATAPLVIGDHSFTMRSGSMTPTLEVGDVVVTEPIAPLAARVGEIVTFRDPEGSGRLFSHRVQSVQPGGDVVHFVTRGDANTATERWSVPADGTVGRVLYRVPKIGYALVWAATPPGRIALIAIPALLLCWTALLRIWRGAGEGEPEGAAGE